VKGKSEMIENNKTRDRKEEGGVCGVRVRVGEGKEKGYILTSVWKEFCVNILKRIFMNYSFRAFSLAFIKV
jgi:hypothetical protein